MRSSLWVVYLSTDLYAQIYTFVYQHKECRHSDGEVPFGLITTRPQFPEELPNEMISWKRKPVWACVVIEEAKRFGVPEGTIRERKKPKSYPRYMALMCDLVDKEPTCFEEATKKKEWVDVMVEEYQSIIKNDVWEVVRIPKNK